MKSNMMNLKGKSGGRMVTTQQVIFEMKHKLVLSLNKLADRDTHQIGVEELQKAAEGLSPELIGPFVSCITDTDSEQKSAVRKECVKVMGTLARFHGSLLAPHLPKMVASVVKRLKDSDSVVRDACMETCSVLAMSIRNYNGANGEGGSGGFIILVRPLFEALGEQNRYVQAGSALCLAKVIDESGDLSLSILPQMLARVVKLLKNPHFMAKPAIIELIRSIIQAGGASSQQALSTAINSITEALKSNDWTTRKAASVALASIAIGAGYLLGSFKASCLRSLECCRFDKVKPVRDAILHAVQCWKALPGPGSPEPSEVGSSTKENFGGDYHDVTSVSDGGWRDSSFRKATPVSVLSGNSITSMKKRAPLSMKRTTLNSVSNHQEEKANDWHIEISLPKSHNPKDAERREANAILEQGIKYEYDAADYKPESSSVSDLASRSYETKHITVTQECIEDCDSENLIGINDKFARQEIEPGSFTSRERKSLDSTVTDLGSQGMHGCCLHAANELTFIKKQLVEIETKQANLLDLLQVFMGNSMDNLSTLQSKVHNLEHAVQKIVHCVTPNESCSTIAISKLLKSQCASPSPRLSISTPRPSVEVNYKPPLLSTNNGDLCRDNASPKSRTATSVKVGVDLWRDPTLNIAKNSIDGRQGRQRKIHERTYCSASNESPRQMKLESMTGIWKQIKELLSTGDVESAYTEAIHSGADHCVIELMDRTGPVLERLTPETTNEVLRVLATHFLDQRLLDSRLHWLQQLGSHPIQGQVVDLCSNHEPRHIFLSPRAQMEFLSAIHEVTTKGFVDPVDRILIKQITTKLSQLCGDVSG
ncbi:Microtubule-associated protein SPIRAL2-like, partial [Ananas comosus]